MRKSIAAFDREKYTYVALLLSYLYLPQISAPFCSYRCDAYSRAASIQFKSLIEMWRAFDSNYHSENSDAILKTWKRPWRSVTFSKNAGWSKESDEKNVAKEQNDKTSNGKQYKMKSVKSRGRKAVLEITNKDPEKDADRYAINAKKVDMVEKLKTSYRI